ncbi:MAG: polymerase sigma-70 factor, subfamily [Actinomycetota bacterium]|nr:polymerase sigma-70 factor, subfamily [Actinomycetota bacterium]
MPEVLVEEPDPQIIAAARGGDTSAFERLVRYYQADVWRFSLHLLHDETLADDVTQDAFVRAFRFLKRYRGDSKFSTWLFSIARNCAMDELRRAGRRKRVTDRLDAERPAAGSDPTLVFEIREAVAALDMELREPMVLIDMFGLSYKDAGKILDLPEGTVKSRVHRARESVANLLSPADLGVSDEV